ncbi:MAG: HAD-IA family hydrolase [Pseudomonadota bacterium]
MPYKALFLGSIGVVSETSDLQRQAFNTAFERFGINWVWSREAYARMLQTQGGRARIAAQAEADGLCDEVDVSAVYALKQTIFSDLLTAKGAAARPGVRDVMAEARKRAMARAFVTSTSRTQVNAIFQGLRGTMRAGDFDYVGDRADVRLPKPAPDIYEYALARLGVAPAEVLCIEDTPESAAAAQAVGLTVVGFPGAAAYGRAFPEGVPVVEFLSTALLDMPAMRIAAE